MSRAASGKGKRYCNIFDDWRYENLGMRCFTLESHQNPSGELVWARSDYLTTIYYITKVSTRHDGAARHPAKNGRIVPSFEEYDPGSVEAILEAWMKYICYVQRLEDSNNDPESSTLARGIVLEEDAASIPCVPGVIRVEDGDRVEMMKKQIQLFISRHHGTYVMTISPWA